MYKSAIKNHLKIGVQSKYYCCCIYIHTYILTDQPHRGQDEMSQRGNKVRAPCPPLLLPTSCHILIFIFFPPSVTVCIHWHTHTHTQTHPRPSVYVCMYVSRYIR
jgi:hypothetical protein